jgi:diguanylate cyclase (GGDEF)-like protein/PAS domain S-box-containing protein
VFETVGALLIVTDRDGRIIRFNAACQNVTGYTFDEVRGRPYWQVVLAPDDVGSVRSVFSDADPSVFPNRNENDWVTRNGERRRISWSNTALLDDNGEVRYLIASGIDITERQKLQAQLEHQAFHDALTGLPNRRFLVERLRRALEGKRARPIALMFIDLDDFKVANDTLGHAGGDVVLVEVARRLRRALRTPDLPARLGGDEFALLMEDVEDPAVAAAVAERLLGALRRPIRVRGTEVHVAASIGIAVGDGRGKRGEELLRNADLAMYAAKAKGKDGWAVYEPSMHAELAERRETAHLLQRAVDQDEFVLQYQPIVDLEQGRVVGVEALVRWDRPGTGLLGPASFIGIAEETGLIVPIGTVVLRRALKDAVCWVRDRADAPWLSVNLSARQFADPGLVGLVADALTESGLDPTRLVLEITESSLMQDSEVTIERLSALKALGIRLAVDDFGTGYSSLSYLRRFPIDILKIDGSFVNASIEPSGRELTLASAIVAIGASLGLETIAEGIETREQQEALVSLGCRLGQGFLFARPVGAASLPALLASAEPAAA